MSRPDPTGRQREAIRAPTAEIVVSAAAGTGKTRVLSDRAVRLVAEDRADLGRLLVVTFTEAAAAEMKARIREGLEEAASARPGDARLRRQLRLLPGAPISTIHAFCLSLLRSRFPLVEGLDPGFRVLDEREARILALETAEAVLRRLHEAGDAAAPALEEAYGGRRGTDLERRLLGAGRFLDTLPDPEGWVRDAAARAAGGAGPEGLAPAFLRVLSLFRRAGRAAKDRFAAVDFADLERLALGILEEPAGGPSAVAGELRDRFVEVLVDEAQDLNPVQERILSLVSRPAPPAGGPVAGPGRGNLFLVGDPKQCIYRFRLAEPAIFVRRAGEASPVPSAPRRRIPLAENFRSRRPIVDAVNLLCGALLRKSTAHVPCGEEDRLVFHAQGYDPAGDEPVEVALFCRDGGGEPAPEPIEREAAWIAARTRALVASGRFRYGDVAVLLRAPRHRAEAFLQALGDAGVPSRADAGGGLLDALEARDLLALLSLLDNPRQDIPLAAHLRSPLLGPGVSDADLARVRALGPHGDFFGAVTAALARPDELRERLRRAFGRLKAWREAARTEGLSALLARIDRETGFTLAVSALPQGAERVRRLHAFFEQARAFDGFARAGLARFLRHLEDLEEELETLPDAAAPPDGEEAVRILSIHRSKGLEFPVVFVANLGREIGASGGTPPILLDRELGIAARDPLPLSLGTVRTEAWARVAARLEAEERAEEIRLLYVALTRARERLFLVGTVGGRRPWRKSFASWAERAPAGEAPLADDAVAEAGSVLDWVGTLLAGRPEGAPIRAALEGEGGRRGETGDGGGIERPLFRVLVDPAAGPAPSGPAAPVSDEPLDPAAEAHVREILRPLPPSPAAGVLSRRTVTEVKRLRDTLVEEGEGPGRAAPGDWRPLRRPEGPTPAERGRIAHRALQCLDLAQAGGADGIRTDLGRLTATGRLTPEETGAVDPDRLARFFASPLGRRVRGSPHVRREVPFSLRLPPAEADPALAGVAGLEGEFVLVQGMIDLLFDEGDRLVLVDWKTDDVPAAAAPARAREAHAVQLALYARAAERILKRPCPERFAVFLSAGASVPLHGGEPERW